MRYYQFVTKASGVYLWRYFTEFSLNSFCQVCFDFYWLFARQDQLCLQTLPMFCFTVKFYFTKSKQNYIGWIYFNLAYRVPNSKIWLEVVESNFRDGAKRKVFVRNPIFGGSCVPKPLPLKDSYITGVPQAAWKIIRAKIGGNKEARSIKASKIGVHSTKTGKMWVKIDVNRLKSVRFGSNWGTWCFLKG